MKHSIDPVQERLLKIDFCQKQMRKSQKHIDMLRKPYADAIRKVRNIEAALIKENKLLKAWERKRDLLVSGQQEQRQGNEV